MKRFFVPKETFSGIIFLYPPCPVFLAFWKVMIHVLKDEKKFFIYHDDFASFIHELERTNKDIVKELKIAEGIHPRNRTFDKKIVERKYQALLNHYAQDMPSKKDEEVTDTTLEDYQNFLRTVAHIKEAIKKEEDDMVLLLDPLSYRASDTPASFYQKVVVEEKLQQENFLDFIKKIPGN